MRDVVQCHVLGKVQPEGHIDRNALDAVLLMGSAFRFAIIHVWPVYRTSAGAFAQSDAQCVDLLFVQMLFQLFGQFDIHIPTKKALSTQSHAYDPYFIFVHVEGVQLIHMLVASIDEPLFSLWTRLSIHRTH